MPWANFVASLLGGVKTAGVIHRLAAVITFGYFLFHVSTLLLYKHRRKLSWRYLLSGSNSLMFNKKDLTDFVATIKWFWGRGPRPDYGRWTYWEKFDYLAVFWGVAIIGLSGLMLWFPEFLTLRRSFTVTRRCSQLDSYSPYIFSTHTCDRKHFPWIR
jgi:thiosulfate reductase cytochrome b subunit